MSETPLQASARCMWMRGGTSKGGYFLAEDLPSEPEARDDFLLRVMGSPDSRQIDGMGGADPLTSKVAVVRKSDREEADVDYLFLQVAVDQKTVTDAQNCGNILAGVAPFAIERGLVEVQGKETRVAIYMQNTGQVAVARVSTPNGGVSYKGEARIDGVPGTSAPVAISFQDTAGSSCGALLPTGNAVDIVDGIEVTMIDNGMPCVVLRATDMGISGEESPRELEENRVLRDRLEKIRLLCGPLMNLGEVIDKTVPKMTMVSAPRNGGTVATRTFIPHRCHKAIGVLGAVSVATACLLEGSPAASLARVEDVEEHNLVVEHPSGKMTVVAQLNTAGDVTSLGVLRTARKLMDGEVFA